MDLALILVIVWVAGLVSVIAGALDAALRPDSTWAAIDQSKIVWVGVIVVLPLVGAIAYYVAIRPKLLAV